MFHFDSADGKRIEHYEGEYWDDQERAQPQPRPELVADLTLDGDRCIWCGRGDGLAQCPVNHGRRCCLKAWPQKRPLPQKQKQPTKERDENCKLDSLLTRLIAVAKHSEYPLADPPIVAEAEAFLSLLRQPKTQPQPESSVCNGHVVHEEYSYCPACDGGRR